MIVVGRDGIIGDIHGEIRRLDLLLADLRRVAAGHLPTAGDLSDTVIIDHWVHASRPEPCLAGQIHGHPNCRGPISVTSGLWLWSPEFGWGRTLSRYYRLGRAFEQNGADLQ